MEDQFMWLLDSQRVTQNQINYKKRMNSNSIQNC